MRLLLCCVFLSSLARAATLTPVWIEFGPDQKVLARVIVDSASDCPTLKAGRSDLPMKLREPIPAQFKPACEAVVPAGTRTLSYAGKRLPLPKTPKTVVVFGDTGCRIKGKQIQNCDDPEKWPLKSVAAQIQKTKPDLIVHVGDYLYRESPCPDPSQGCSGPYGDNWPTWNADFFSPAASALAAAPWAFSRGNHEDCKRAWRGWFYYLDPRPYRDSCSDYSDPYIAESGSLHIGMLDSAATKEDEQDTKQIAKYAGQLASFSGKATWVADHHPFWAYKSEENGDKQAVVSQPLAAAWDQSHIQGVRMVLSGHIHLFEFLGFEGTRPIQLVAGDGGTDLAKSVHADFSGDTVSGAAVKAGKSVHDFGFTTFVRARNGWQLTLKDSTGRRLVHCDVPETGTSSCQAIQ